MGAKVAVINYVTPTPKGTKWGLGGTCVNVGCIPNKLMHEATIMGDTLNEAKCYGWKLPASEHITHNWCVLTEAIQNQIKSVNWTTRVELKESKVDYINGFGRFKSPHEISVKKNDGETVDLSAEYILIAVGGRPRYPNIPGALDFGITSDDIFSLKKPPGKTMIVGAGYVGLECAGFLNGLGYDTTVLVRSVVLRGFDQQMAQIITSALQDKGVKFEFKFTPKSIIKQPNNKLLFSWQNKNNQISSDYFDTVLFAIGRQPPTRDMLLENAGVKISEENDKLLTENEQTNVPHIFGVGDVLFNKPELTPVAIQAGQLLAKRLFGKEEDKKCFMDYNNVATTVFTPAKYACIGYSEENALQTFGSENIEVYHSNFKPTEYFIPKKPTQHCYIKVITKRNERKEVIGMHIIGPHAAEIMQGFAAAMKCGLTMDILSDTVGIHPTVAEEFTRVNITKRSGFSCVPSSCCS
ncbi:unnamed protein product [Brassicogethes aeneus]|uniref:Uncharacterized protein n=1 Tax=Brassicogethes aeneus TaxID=1431903 RepID=A0A9P0B0C8_BRAAE|nr:unnamed protein product [Brassicogethes aeneus]